MKKLWLYLVLFLIGSGLILFPLVSQYLYFEVAHEEIISFDAGVAELPNEELAERLRLAVAYNSAVDFQDIADPWTDIESEGLAEYARMLEVQEKLGYVEIPKLEARLPIYAGTTEVVLQKGVGHLEGTALPIGGLDTHSVLTAHRGLPTAQLFRRLDELEIGDIFFVTTIGGKLAYQVDQILVVEPTEITAVQTEAGKDLLTLLTCTPYMVNSHRLLVRGERIAWEETEATSVIDRTAEIRNPWTLWLIVVSSILLGGLVYVGWLIMKRR